MIPLAGGMAERFKAAVLKIVDRKVRGFESLSLRHPVWPIVALQRRVRFSARLAGFCRIGGTRDALEGLNWPHFRYSSLISIFECQVCARTWIQAFAQEAWHPVSGRCFRALTGNPNRPACLHRL